MLHMTPFYDLMIYPHVTHKAAHFFCRFCLHGFTREQLLKEHEGECFVHGGQKTVFPANTVVKFNSIAKQLQAPFAIYADFESILEAADIGTEKTKKYQLHRACSYMYYIVSSVPSAPVFEPRLYVGEDAAEHMLKSLARDLKLHILPVIERNAVPMIWDREAEKKFESATDCHICGEQLLVRPPRRAN